MNRPLDDSFIPTRQSLLERLKDLEDQASWREFFDTYWKLIYGVALKSGLTEAEAQDAVQETVIAVARTMPEFRYDPARCSFKGWLLLLTRQRIAHQFRKRLRAGQAPWPTQSGLETRVPKSSDDTSRTDTIDRVPDPDSLDLDALWNAEWEKNLMAAALERVKARVSARQYQMFDLYVLQEWPAREVARTLRVSVAHMYLAKHRISGLLKEEVQRLEAAGT
jgi:RNA polymerase sigma-70 factor (ECF subfamily)